MSRRSRIPLMLFGAASLVACDSQVTPSYGGESLLRLRGSVTLANEPRGELVPALGFINEDNDTLEIVDVEVQGSFPSRFTLDVTVPPPPAALMKGPPHEPDFALGYITAVAPNHPARIAYSSIEAGGGYCDADYCYYETDACTADKTSCFHEEKRCTAGTNECEVTASEGDPALVDDPRSSFAGISQNYVVLYLAGPLAADSSLARDLTGYRALAAGYHLVEKRQATDEENDASNACYDRALEESLAIFNEAHGTDYTTLYTEPGTACLIDAPECAPTPPKPGPEDEELDEIYELLDDRQAELACPEYGTLYFPVDDPANTPITVYIGPRMADEEDDDGGGLVPPSGEDAPQTARADGTPVAP